MKLKTSKIIIKSLACIAAAVIFAITFIEHPSIPSWSDIFGKKETIDPNADVLTILDVGNADCALFSSNGRYGLIDTGDGKNKKLPKQIQKKGANGFDVVMLSHWHDDHYGGVEDFFKRFTISNFVTPKIPAENDAGLQAEQLINFAENHDTNTVTYLPGMTAKIGDFTVTTVYCNFDADDENNRSAINIAECHGYKAIFMGDLETSEEKKLLSSGLNLDCDIIKIGHHGSKTSTGTDLLKAVTPDYAVISVGASNSYGHPSHEVLNRLEGAEITYLRTDYDGDISFTFTPEGITVNTEHK